MLREEKTEYGAFLCFDCEDSFSYREFEYKIEFDEFLCSYRDRPFFMNAAVGSEIEKIPPEVQFLLTKKGDVYTVFYPLSYESIRACVRGGEDGFFICVETGDRSVEVSNGTCAYTAFGAEPYELIRNAVSEIAEKLGTFKLKKDKPLPKFMKYFGWCTWNAMGINVSTEKVIEGLKSFGERKPRFLIMDDGWQTTNNIYGGQGQWKLASFKENSKIDGGLKGLVAKCREMGVDEFFVWHALMGYWGGIDTEAPEMKKYEPELKFARFGDGLRKNNEACCRANEIFYGLAANDKIFDFYNDYHKYLRLQGVDGVKVDTQYYGEAVADGRGGRCELYTRLREGLEASVNLNFGGELINCMSAGNDITYRLKASNMTRTSDDFYPDKAESHGVHIFKNAVNTLFTRDISVADWDMFMTKHDYGAFHAAARAVSGGPVYVTDAIGEHDFDVIDKLRLKDGTVPLCEDCAVPVPECLMLDPFSSDKAYRIINKNKFSSVSAAFNFNTDGKAVSGNIDGKWYSFNTQNWVTGEYKLPERGFDIFTKPEIKDGFGALGLTSLYNMGGTVKEFKPLGDFAVFELAGAGEAAFFCDEKPSCVICGGKNIEFSYTDGIVKINADRTDIIIKK